MDRLISFLKKEEVEFRRDETLSCHTSLGIGGVASLFVVPKSKEKLTKTLDFLIENNTPYFVCGNMTNLLVSDAKLSKVIVSTLSLDSYSFSHNEVVADSGALFSKIILSAAKKSMGGCESLFGIPGTVGGMVRVNAGAYGSSVSDFFVSAEVYDPSSKRIFTVNMDEAHFAYRDSDFKRRNLIILSARLRFFISDYIKIIDEITEVRKRRIGSQPLDKRSLGSVFKRTEAESASYLIDQCGLKGMRVGGISVSEKHAGFFINDGTGTSDDFLRLSEIVKAEVFRRRGIILSEEFEYLA